MLSIIVPAHNEQAVIARGLASLARGAPPDDVEIIVACNGCSDRTAEIARGFGPPVRVLEIDPSSKIAAMNAADAVATGFPRFYVDADTELDYAAVRKIADVLERGPFLMANPEPVFDFSEASWAVRAYYRVWTALPYNRESGHVGTGVYAVSRAGRARWERFPDVIADDAFVRSRFEPHERTCVEGAQVRVEPPRTWGALLKVKSRSRLGLFQLRAAGWMRGGPQPGGGSRLISWLAGRPALWLSAPVYLLTTLLAARRAAAQQRTLATYVWERDETSRRATAVRGASLRGE